MEKNTEHYGMPRKSLYLYGIIDDPDIRPRFPVGLANTTPEVLAMAGLGAVVGCVEGKTFAADADNVRRCQRVLEALTGQCTVLPAQFGLVYAGQRELEDYLSNSLETLHADMDKVRGHIEIGVRITGGGLGVAAEGADAGRQAPKNKQDQAALSASQKRAIEEFAHTVIAPLSPLARSHTWRVAPSSTGQPGLSLALLLRPERLEDLRGVLAELRRAKPRLELSCTGPWPPYSFVSGVQTGARGEHPDNTVERHVRRDLEGVEPGCMQF